MSVVSSVGGVGGVGGFGAGETAGGIRARRDPATDERWARVAWSLIAEPHWRRPHQWVAEYGAVDALARCRAGALTFEGDLEGRIAALDLEGSVRGIHRLGLHVLIPGDPGWPTRVENLTAEADPPHVLYVRGDPDLAALTERSIAVVGARAASPYGLQVAADLGAGLAGRGWTVVSGAAFGIDAASHRGALSVEGPTVAVLACGLDRPYPRAHETLIAEIARAGAVVSENPPGCAAWRSRFLARNRLIAGLTVGTVVVEAALRSGSLNTARLAQESGRSLACVPGPVTSARSAGCHEWIRAKGAQLVTDAADVLDLMGPMGQYVQPARRAPDGPLDELSESERDLWSAVPVRGGADTARLAALTGLPVRSALATLGRLEVLGLVRRDDQGWRKAPRPKKTQEAAESGQQLF